VDYFKKDYKMNTKELELIIDGKSNQSTAGKVWTVTKFLTACTWGTGKFIVKNSPTAIGIAREVKKGISEEIAIGIQEISKKQKQLKLEEKIKMLSHKGAEE